MVRYPGGAGMEIVDILATVLMLISVAVLYWETAEPSR
jgi:hypothetical protein